MSQLTVRSRCHAIKSADRASSDLFRFRWQNRILWILLMSVAMVGGALSTAPSGGPLTKLQAEELTLNSAPEAADAQVESKVPEASGDAAALPESVPAPPPILRIVRTEAIFGQPYGVARATIPIQKELGWHPDQPLTVQGKDDRLLYPCHSIRDSDEGAELIVRFLFKGREPLLVDVLSAKGPFVKGHQIPVDEDPAAHEMLMTEWWPSYRDQLIEGPSEELSGVGRDIASIVGRRFDLAVPPRRRNQPQSSNLERQFERSAGMLFGFESVRLAMMKDASPVESLDRSAVLQLPNPIGVPAVPIPHDFDKTAAVELLAAHVPPECFYVRCQSFQNYLWLRGLVMGWGGSLEEMVATPVVDLRVRERIERQLCLDPSIALKLELDQSLEDFALIGGDTYFAEGAAIGVLMQGNKTGRLPVILDLMRRNVAKLGGAEHRMWSINRVSVSSYSTPDNVIRSYHVSSGNVHLVTNSSKLVHLFVGCDKGRNLASLPEFRHARTKFPLTRELTSFLYLSDPFFRNLTSPKTRIEAARRQHAINELRQLNLARMIAVAEGLKANSITDLIEHRLLPPEFGKRADQSSPNWTSEGQLVDSLRGGLGTFLPIADVPVHLATRSEVNAYDDFTNSYLREWRAMDPVSVALHRQPTADPRDERVDIEIVITPYAREAYGFLANYLAPASDQRVKPSKTDVLALTARLRGGDFYNVCIGLRDVAIPFQIEQGKLIKQGQFEHRTFADWRSYAAVSPPGTGGLQLVGAFTKSLQSREFTSPNNSTPAPERSSAPRSGQMWLSALSPAMALPLSFASVAFGGIFDEMSKSYVDTRGDWTVLARDRGMRCEAADELTLEFAPNTSQIQLRVKDVNQANIGPYLHAVSWETGRRQSGENSAWLSRLAATLKFDVSQTRRHVEQLLGGELQCPLGGNYAVIREGETSQLVSDVWGQASRFNETAVPVGYRLPFLAWMRGLNLDFELSRTTLTSRIQLHVDPTVVRDLRRNEKDAADTADLQDEVVQAEREMALNQMFAADQQLSRALNRFDPSGAWTAYLAIPTQPPHNDSDLKKLHAIAARFDLVATDRKYLVITQLTGFTEARSRLERCLKLLDAQLLKPKPLDIKQETKASE